VLGRFHRAHPDVQLEVRTGPTAELLEHVLAHRLDAALVAGPVDHADLAGETVFREELVLVAARDGQDLDARLRAGGLTAIVFRQGCSYRQRLEAHFSSRGWLPFRRLEFGTLEGVLGCVGAGIGVTMLPRSAVEGYRGVDDLEVKALTPKPMWVETLLVRRRDAQAGAEAGILLVPAQELQHRVEVAGPHPLVLRHLGKTSRPVQHRLSGIGLGSEERRGQLEGCSRTRSAPRSPPRSHSVRQAGVS
jgi:DNA-binding transcriptional LysR family regulator